MNALPMAVTEPTPLGAAEIAELQAEISELARARDARDPRPQLPVARGPGRRRLRRRLARALAAGGRRRRASTIAFCGVHFMAETASILSPDKTVLIPDLDAGCSLAESITAAQLAAWKAEHPERDRRDVRQHLCRGQGADRLLLHLRRTPSRSFATSSSAMARTPRSSSAPTCSSAPTSSAILGRPHARLGRRVPRARRHPPVGHRRRRAPRIPRRSS